MKDCTIVRLPEWNCRSPLLIRFQDSNQENSEYELYPVPHSPSLTDFFLILASCYLCLRSQQARIVINICTFSIGMSRSGEPASFAVLKYFPAFYGTLRFITVLTSVLQRSLSVTRPQHTSSSIHYVHIIIMGSFRSAFFILSVHAFQRGNHVIVFLSEKN
jgi:hypothetical protein